MAKGSFSFMQIGDSHIGFSKPGINTDVTASAQQARAHQRTAAVARFHSAHRRLDSPRRPEFDTLAQLLKSAKTQQIFFVPASMMSPATTANFISSASGAPKVTAEYSFDHRGVHFIGLINTSWIIQQNGLGARPGTTGMARE
jgi:hypothetical protein